MTDLPSNGAQLASPSYRLPALDTEFLLSDSMRGVRFQLEFAEADQALRDWGVRSTVVVFGSARVREDGPPDHARWYAEARRFGALASRLGGAMRDSSQPRDNVIATGGGPGIMAAANRGAADVGAPSIGFNITLPHEEEPNPLSTPDLTFRTFDELFEILTLRQTGKAPPIPVVLVDEAHWRAIVGFDALVAAGLIAASDLELFRFAETAEGAWQALLNGGLKPYRATDTAPAP